jgi:hypothetical protein
MHAILITPAALVLATLTSFGAERHVSPSGRDTNPGTAVEPLATFDAARRMVRSLAGREPVTVWFHEGVYYRGGYHYRITGKNDAGEVTYEGGWQNNRQMGMHPKDRFVENIFEELEAPGEWFHDPETNTLHYLPPDDVNLRAAVLEIV